jgi:AcrR family transcriptional regulator
MTRAETEDEIRSAAPSPAAEQVKAAVVAAAIRLFSERRPSTVSLREIAREAGVNYGLIHRHFGTREAVLRVTFDTLKRHAGAQMAEAGDFDALRRTLWKLIQGDLIEGETYARMMAWALLDGQDPNEFLGASFAGRELRRLLPPAGAQDLEQGHDRRLLAATIVLLGLAWKLFSPALIVEFGLQDRDAQGLYDELGQIADVIAGLSGERAPG